MRTVYLFFGIWNLVKSYFIQWRLICIQCGGPHLRVGCVILLERWAALVPTKEAGRGRELRGTADWLVLAFRGCGTNVALALMGWGSDELLGMECRLTEVDSEVELGPCCTVGLT